jgi:hypothetical protein
MIDFIRFIHEKRGRFKSIDAVRLYSALGDITASTGMPREAGCEQSVAVLTIGSESTKTEISNAEKHCAALQHGRIQ